jgi:hypothetical protein
MGQADENQRSYMRCGFIAEQYHKSNCAPPPMTGYPNNDTTCPGYTTALPDVADVALSFPHWEKGQLGLANGGVEPCQAFADGLVEMHFAFNAFQSRPREGQ